MANITRPFPGMQHVYFTCMHVFFTCIHVYAREIHVLHTWEWSSCVCHPQKPLQECILLIVKCCVVQFIPSPVRHLWSYLATDYNPLDTLSAYTQILVCSHHNSQHERQQPADQYLMESSQQETMLFHHRNCKYFDTIINLVPRYNRKEIFHIQQNPIH